MYRGLLGLPATLDKARVDNNAATSAPTVRNDNTQGYAVGSRWLWAARGMEWVALDVTAGAARWELVRNFASNFPKTIQRRMANNIGSSSIGPSEEVFDGTLSNVSVTDRPYTGRMATAATVDARASHGLRLNKDGENRFVIPSAGNNRFPPRMLTMEFCFPDASYGSGSTGSRIVAGFFGGTNFGWITDHALGQSGDAAEAAGMWLRYDTNASDTNWQLVRRGTAVSSAVVLDTGIPFVSSMTDLWNLTFINDRPNEVRVILSRPETGTYWTSLITTSLPTEVEFAVFGGCVRTLTNVARNYGWASGSVMGGVMA
jgi:hypothetical protein